MISAHTHAPEGYEMYKGAPIVYSMGNFFFPRKKVEKTNWFYGYLSELQIEKGKVDLKTYPYQLDNEKVWLLEGKEKEFFDRYMEKLIAPLKDEKEIQSLFDAWCVKSGYHCYLWNATFTHEMENDKIKSAPIKNLFSCESHNELIQNTTKIIFECRLEEAEIRLPEIQKLQQMAVE